jgi:uncharacterized membrane protein YecN with MAPEG domain
MPLATAAVFIAILTLITAGLAFNISVGRFRRHIPHGDGPNHELARAIRAHMNSVEHSLPIGLLLLTYALLQGNPSAIPWIGTVAVVARIALSVGILRKGAFSWRRYGAFVTYALEVLLVALVLVAAAARLRA